MCGRYDNLIPRDALVQLFRLEILPPSNFPPRYNIAPTQDIPVVRLEENNHHELMMARWGLIPYWMKEKPKQPHINARAEAVDRTPMFREAFASRRCLIPATGFYEWERREGGKHPFRFVMKDRAPFAFAGMWEAARIGGERVRSATIIVTAANDLVGRIHDRMPVILGPEAYETWLDPLSSIDEVKSLLAPFPSAGMDSYPVSQAVNHYENDNEACIEPVELAAVADAGDPEQPDLPGL